MTPVVPSEKILRRLGRLRFQWRVVPAAAPAGSRRAPRPGSSREFQGLRPYEVGDDVRDLDWAATSRFDRAYVRLYHQEAAASLLLLIDCSASMGFGDPTKLAYAQGLACALGYLALAHHDRVGAVAFTDRVTAWLPTGRRSGQWGALRDLVGGLTARGRTALTEIPMARAPGRGLHGLAVILSDFCPREAFAASLARLARSSLSAVALHIVSPEELDPVLEGELELVDLETGEARSGWIGAAQRAAYRDALARLGTEVARSCRESGIRYVRVSTAVPIVQCLQDTLVRAGILRPERS